jgi:hypothetical protein
VWHRQNLQENEGSISMEKLILLACPLAAALSLCQAGIAAEPMYVFTLSAESTPQAYDEAVAATTMQGIINRGGPRLYLLSGRDERPQYWLDILSRDGRWMKGRPRKPLAALGDIRALAGSALKGAVIWDPKVPASLNVATTMAGIEDAVVLSPELAEQAAAWQLPVLVDLRWKFTGKETGSAKNDAYRWAIREFIEKGRCNSHWLFLYEDAADTRHNNQGGTRFPSNVGYAVTRDWAVRNRGFVFDLSPWGDEAPADDPNQSLGTDLATYKLILDATMKQAAGKQMTELAGFFAFQKYSNTPPHASKHDPVPTEWETVHLISPYNGYQNTAADHCYNQSFHCQALLKPLKQPRPAAPKSPEAKTYLCILMADYDSAMPLYQMMPKSWDDPARGTLPLCWGVNPNLLETYPDIIAYLYETARPNDVFTADASAAGYMNPNRILPEYLPLFVRHNKRFFEQADMTLAPMVLDWDEPSAAVKDAFVQFAPDGFATIVMDFHKTGGKSPTDHVWKGMVVANLDNSSCNSSSPEELATLMKKAIAGRVAKGQPTFMFFRIVWVPPGNVAKAIETLKTDHPEWNLEIVNPYAYFALLKRHIEARP